MPREPVVATHLTAPYLVTDILHSDVAGAYSFDVEGTSLGYICPCGCGDFNSLPVVIGKKDKTQRGWSWNGNREVPTIEPSIRRRNGCRFHGFLTNGKWEFCGDSGVTP